VRPACLAPVIALMIGACGAQEIAFDAPDAPGPPDGGAGGDGGAESSPATGCTNDLDCPLGLHCDARISGQCVPCVMNSHCTQPGHHVCDFALNLCVECGTSGDCASGLCVDTRCVPSCADGGLCPDTYYLCNQRTNVCIGCRSNGDCAGARGGPVCDTSIGQCVECVSNDQCPRDQPRCNPTSGRCVECLTSQSCFPGEACDPMAHVCVEVRVAPQAEGGAYDAGAGDAHR
jgi:hypothetical protein